MASTFKILVGDVRERLSDLPDGSIHCAVTSPPYWSLRDYGTATWEGGNDPNCDHIAAPSLSDQSRLRGGNPHSYADKLGRGVPFLGGCGKCGARRIDAQIGLERRPEEYVESLVDVFRHVRRVLRPDGTLWLNLGDCYAGSKGTSGSTESWSASPGQVGADRSGSLESAWRLKPKDLVGVPWRVAFALQADGWWLRSNVIWDKPNPMPASVTDRPTLSHEFVFMLTKEETYYYDAESAKEESRSSGWRKGRSFPRFADKPDMPSRSKSFNKAHPSGSKKAYEHRNWRTVWTMNSQDGDDRRIRDLYGDHYAKFPDQLPRRCIVASCPVGGTVLDPFTGSGTTGVAAIHLRRSFVGVDLNPEYARAAERRIRAAACSYAMDEHLEAVREVKAEDEEAK